MMSVFQALELSLPHLKTSALVIYKNKEKKKEKKKDQQVKLVLKNVGIYYWRFCKHLSSYVCCIMIYT